MNMIRWLFLILVLNACRQPYEPPVIKAPNQYLVVEGVINANSNGVTSIVLSKTKNLADTVQTNPEAGARVAIESNGGALFLLNEQGAGTYRSGSLNLNSSQQYRLRIRTADGREYLSAFVPVKQTPPIADLYWEQDRDLAIYLNTNDPSNRSRFYRWDYVETWQYDAQLVTFFGLGVSNGIIFFRDASNQQSTCWMDSASKEIILASSRRLGEDVISRQPIVTIPQNSKKVWFRYSILVKQYALTEDAYLYWEVLKQNTQNLGTLFDRQPGQLKSNIQNVANAAEPVIGYCTASTIQEKRLFVRHADLQAWDNTPPPVDCGVLITQPNPNNPLIWDNLDTSYAPYFFSGSNPGSLLIAKKNCVDCRSQGGTNQKPGFW